jgi:DNA-directed RNA polymerase specialized sigma24 family protein
MREFVAAFRQLSQGTREALLLAKLEGQSYERIAKSSGISVGTVKSRIWRGRALLDHLLAPRITPRRHAHPFQRRTNQCLPS